MHNVELLSCLPSCFSSSSHSDCAGDGSSSQNGSGCVVVSNVSPPARGRALDLFTGTGSVAKQLREMGYEVLTLDVI